MPAAAAVARGILLSIGIIAALGLAVMENPQVQEWLEQQRKKIAELLQSVGNELDPASRRQAEAFAYGGRTTTTDGEAQAGAAAAAIATGRALENTSASRRIPIAGPNDPDAAEERKRMGRAYLIRREQQMIELQRRRSLAMVGGAQAVPDATSVSSSFDQLVDSQGNLRKEEAPPVTADQLPEQIREEARLVEKHLDAPIAAASAVASSSVAAAAGASSANAWQLGSSFANPFGDEFELDRSVTPRPPTIPPKVALSVAPDPEISVPGEFPASPVRLSDNDEQSESYDHLSYEEQLAVALSLSEQDAGSQPSTTTHHDEDPDLHAAIAASLRDMSPEQASHAVSAFAAPPLIDISAAAPIAPIPMRHVPGQFEALFTSPPPLNQSATGERITYAGSAYPALPAAASGTLSPRSEVTDELYRITPQLTRARLASLDASNRAAAERRVPAEHAALDASFYSAVSLPSVAQTDATLDHEAPSFIHAPADTEMEDDEEEAEGARTPTTLGGGHALGFHPAPSHVAESVRTDDSDADVDVVSVADDDDEDEEEDGILTPDSWSEIDEREAEEGEGAEHLHHHSMVGA